MVQQNRDGSIHVNLCYIVGSFCSVSQFRWLVSLLEHTLSDYVVVLPSPFGVLSSETIIHEFFAVCGNQVPVCNEWKVNEHISSKYQSSR